MRPRLGRRPQAALTASALALGAGAFTLLPHAAAEPPAATGFATENGGTTGGQGGQTVRATTGTQIHQALCGRASSTTPIIIEVEGTINHGNTSQVSGSCSTASDEIGLKRVSNITIVGVGRGATFDQLGIHLREAKNIIIQNVTIKNVKKSGSPLSNGGDAISMEKNVSNVWVDHATLEASGGEAQGYDGLFDMKDDTKYVTLSYSILRNSGRGGLVGSSESDRSNSFLTFHHNLYSNIESRAPLLRGGIAHMYNNYYVKLGKSGINSRAGAKAKVENNYFKDSKDVLGTFYTSQAGSWQVAGNVLDNVTWSGRDGETNPAGPAMQSTTTVDIPYPFRLDGAACVPQIVTQTAGAGTGLKVSNGNCSASTPTASSTSSTTTPRPTSTTPPPATSGPTGTNLSLSAGSDGSSKAKGTSYASVRDGSLTTYWSPAGSTGSISLKWTSTKTLGSVAIREASGATGVIGSWKLVNADTGAQLASGQGAGLITFKATSLKKITFVITSATGTPRVAEFQSFTS